MFQFSAAKSAAEAKTLQSLVYDEDKKIKSPSKFNKEAKEVTDIFQETWLRVERDICVRSSVQGERFRSMMEDSDLYPYWIYKGVMDDREREEHVELEGQIFKIGDPAGDACFPPDDWNCRCSGDELDDDELANRKVNTNSEAKQLLDEHVDEQFRYNPAEQGMFPNDKHSYFEVLGNANKANAELFDEGDIESDESLTGLGAIIKAATGLHYFIETVNEWKEKYETNKSGDVIFQNKQTLTNIRFTANSLHEVQKHSRGFENIPKTVQRPDEIWMSWKDAENQKVVLRNYIKFGKTCYIVQTQDGVIVDAFAISKKAANKYRKGVIS